MATGFYQDMCRQWALRWHICVAGINLNILLSEYRCDAHEPNAGCRHHPVIECPEHYMAVNLIPGHDFPCP